jgi:hypothetical protein
LIGSEGQNHHGEYCTLIQGVTGTLNNIETNIAQIERYKSDLEHVV